MPTQIEEHHPLPSRPAIPSHLLKKALNRLSEVTPGESPLISCFVNLEENLTETLRIFERQAEDISEHLLGQRADDFKSAFDEIHAFLRTSVSKETKGAAIYCRRGERPLFLPLEFNVPLDSKLVVDSLPHLYPVIETKDTYHRFAIVVVTEEEARIVETVMGSVTEEIFTSRPELRERLGREWTREHYQNHRKSKDDQYLEQKVSILEALMTRKGHNHLVVAGTPEIVAKFTKVLPPHLKVKLITTLDCHPRMGTYSIVVKALEFFAANEHIESHSHVEDLEKAVMANGLGVAGINETKIALEGGYADMLIIDHNLNEPVIKEELVRLPT